MSLRKYNLNLLTVLDALLRHRSVTRAGQELGLSQSAASHALLRLREQFGDELLVQIGREMVPTHRAEALMAPLEATLATLERLLETEKFEPAESVRAFTIGTADYIAALILPGLMHEIERSAPNVTVNVTWANRDVATKLRNGELDLAIIPRGMVEDDLHSAPLFADDLAVAAAARHPEIGETINVETFLSLPHVALRKPNHAGRSFSEIQLIQNNLQPRPRLLVSEFMLLLHIVSHTNYITVIHRRLGEMMQRTMDIRLLEPPFSTEKLNNDAFWAHEAHSDPGHTWFRELLISVSSNLANA